MQDNLCAYIEAAQSYTHHRQQAEQHGGEWVRAIRSAKGLSIAKFAVLLKVTPDYLSKLENGKQILSPDLARRLLVLSEPE